MTLEEMKSVIDEQMAPVLSKQKEYEEKQKQYEDTQRKYADIFDQKPKAEEKKELGFTFTRAIKCLTLAKNDPEKALFYAEGKSGNSMTGMYPNDNEVKALLKALSATTPSEGGFLIAEQYSRDIIPLLRSKIAVMQLGVRRIPMPKGNMNIPKITGGAASYYVGENQNATKSQQTFGNIKLSSKKLVTLVPVSNDLIRDSSPEADALVRDDMIQEMALKVDYTEMYGSGSAFEPLGIKKSVTTANISLSTAVITADLPGTIISQTMTDNIPMLSCGWVFNSKTWGEFYNLKTTTNQYIYRDEMNRGSLNGFPFKI
ncbi:MAG: phage major capsid protein, partial [Phycisphaerae bacterium]